MDIRPLLLLARAISAAYKNVHVQFTSGGTACCACKDGQYTIYLPLSDSKDSTVLYRGYIDHEVGHVRFTNFFADTCVMNDMEKAFANIFEDEFVERRMGKLFPGSEINLRNLARRIFNSNHMHQAIQRGAQERLFALALYHRRALLDAHFEQWHAEIDQAVLDLGVPPADLAKMLELLRTPANSTEENNALARKLYKFMQPYINAPMSQSGQSDQSDQGSQSDQSDQGSQSDQSDQGGQPVFSVDGRVSQILNAAPPAIDLGDAAWEWLLNAHFAEQAPCLFPVVLDETLVSALRKRIPALLQSSRIKPCVISSRGRLYGKRLARVAVLDNNVFHAPAKKVAHDIEVGFLSDYSGSMDGISEKLDKTVYASLVMLKELPKVKAFAFGFNGRYYHRLMGKNENARRGFSSFIPNGGTPLSRALLRIVDEFASTGRRILIVTTDGVPDGDFSTAKAVIDLVASMGIEIYAVGLGRRTQQFLPELFGEDRSAVLSSIAEYPVSLEKVLRKAMLCAN